MLKIDILSVLPEMFGSYFDESLFKRAQSKKLVRVKVYDIRDFTADKHHKVDDRPFGGGPGMVLKVEPIAKAVRKILGGTRTGARSCKNVRTRVILFSTRGQKFDAAAARRLARYDRLVLICGRYEGVDERVAEHIADEEISMGDYVLSGGEIPAMAVTEAVCRFLPGFIGKQESLEELKGSYPVYTRPEEFYPPGGGSQSKSGKGKKKWRVPKVLISGNHSEIDAWRRQLSGSSGVPRGPQPRSRRRK